MKRITYYLSSLFLLAAFGMFSCTKSDETPSTTTITYENNVPDGTITVNYTVQVVPGNAFDEQRSAGLDGATVSITQNGETEIQVTDQAGFAHFPGMKNGTVSGAVVHNSGNTEYVTANFTANLDAGEVNTDVEQIKYASSMVTIFERNAELDGRIWADFLNLGVEPPTLTTEFTRNTDVFVVYKLGEDYPMGEGSGALTTINMEIMNFYQRTNADGKVNMSDLPGTVEGLLSASFFMQDIVEPDPSDPSGSKVFLYNIQPITNTEGIALNLIPGSSYHLGTMKALKKP